MTTYVCAQLTIPTYQGEAQACVAWVEQTSVIPDLTSEQVVQLCSAFALFLCVCAIFKLLRRAI